MCISVRQKLVYSYWYGFYVFSLLFINIHIGYYLYIYIQHFLL